MKDLPTECFKPHTKQVLHYVLFIALYLTGLFLVLNISNFFIRLPISIVMGIILASLTFFLHDLLHGSIVRSKKLSYIISLSIGIFILFAPFFWKRLHNLHHAKTQSADDPDRSYTLSEKPKNKFERIIYKSRVSNEAFHPFISLVLMSTGFFWYFLNTMFHGLIPLKLTNNIKHKKVHQLFNKNTDKISILLELFFIFGFQLFLFSVLTGGDLLTYFLTSLLPVLIAHFIAMSYIHTNHFLSPLTDKTDDPLVNSLSIKNNWLIDKIFLNFSHHVEHHLFPSMSSSHYPTVRKLLEKHYPERFKLVTHSWAIKMLFSTPRIYSDCLHLMTLDGNKIMCLVPSKQN